MGSISSVLDFNALDLTEEEKVELRAELVKQGMKSVKISNLLSKARRRENARLKADLAAAALESGNVTKIRKE